jgi:hypothetical protein
MELDSSLESLGSGVLEESSEVEEKTAETLESDGKHSTDLLVGLFNYYSMTTSLFL